MQLETFEFAKPTLRGRYPTLRGIMAKPKHPPIEIGTGIYYTGDVANQPGYGVVVAILPATRFMGPEARIILDDGRDFTYAVDRIAHTYDGVGPVRVMTVAAYNAWRTERMRGWLQATGNLSEEVGQ